MTKERLREALSLIVDKEVTGKNVSDVLAGMDRKGRLDSKVRNELLGVICKFLLEDEEDTSI